MAKMRVERILCAVNQTDHSAYALMWAASVARAFSAKLYVLHAACLRPPLEFTHDQVDEILDRLEEATAAAGEIISQWAARYIPEDLQWETLITRRQPVEGIVEQADQIDADLIVMGTRGRTGIMRWFIGSVAEGVIHATSRPCLVARHTGQPLGADHLPEVRRLLCPVNYTPVARECLEASGDLARVFGAELVVLHSVEAGADDQDHLGILCGWVPPDVRSACALQEVVRHGRPGDQIVRYARDNDVSLIVIGAQRKLLADVPVFGTTTEHVVRLAPCPVLVIHREAEEAEQ